MTISATDLLNKLESTDSVQIKKLTHNTVNIGYKDSDDTVRFTGIYRLKGNVYTGPVQTNDKHYYSNIKHFIAIDLLFHEEQDSIDVLYELRDYMIDEYYNSGQDSTERINTSRKKVTYNDMCFNDAIIFDVDSFKGLYDDDDDERFIYVSLFDGNIDLRTCYIHDGSPVVKLSTFKSYLKPDCIVMITFTCDNSFNTENISNISRWKPQIQGIRIIERPNKTPEYNLEHNDITTLSEEQKTRYNIV